MFHCWLAINNAHLLVNIKRGLCALLLPDPRRHPPDDVQQLKGFYYDVKMVNCLPAPSKLLKTVNFGKGIKTKREGEICIG